VHMTLFPEGGRACLGIAKDAREVGGLAQVRAAVLVALEQARARSSSAAASKRKVHLHAGPEAAGLQKLLEEKQSVLPHSSSFRKS